MHLDDLVEDPPLPSGSEPGHDNTGESSVEKPFVIPEMFQSDDIKNEAILFSKFEWKSRHFEYNDDEFERRARNYNPFQPTELQIQQLEMLGILRPLARKALRITRGDVERAADWAFNNWDSPIDDNDEDLHGIDTGFNDFFSN